MLRPCDSGHTTHRLFGATLGERKQYVVRNDSFGEGAKLTVTDGQNDLLIVSTLDLLHGILLIHPPSRTLFAREIYMNVSPLILHTQKCKI